MGDSSLGSVCLFMSLISVLSTLLLWPVFLGLSLAGLETISWTQLPWLELSAAAALTLSTTRPTPDCSHPLIQLPDVRSYQEWDISFVPNISFVGLVGSFWLRKKIRMLYIQTQYIAFLSAESYVSTNISNVLYSRANKTSQYIVCYTSKLISISHHK